MPGVVRAHFASARGLPFVDYAIVVMLKNEKSSLPIARANLTDLQFTDEFTLSTWFIVAMGERLVLSDCALTLPAFVSDDGSSLVPDRTRKSHVARLPSAPALTINGSERFPRSRSETGER